MRLCYIHRVVSANDLLVLAVNTFALLRVVARIGLRNHWVSPASRVEDGQLTATCSVRRYIIHIVVQVLLHNGCVCALRQLTSFLDPALPKNALS